MRVTEMNKSFKSVVAALAICLAATSSAFAASNTSQGHEAEVAMDKIEQQMLRFEKQTENFDVDEYISDLDELTDDELDQYLDSDIVDPKKFKEYIRKNSLDMDNLDNFENFDFDLSEPQELTVKPILI